MATALASAAPGAFLYFVPTLGYAAAWWLASGAAPLVARRLAASGPIDGDRPGGPEAGAALGRPPPSRREMARWVLVATVILHAATLFLPWSPGSFHFGFGKLLSATALVGVMIWWVESASVPLGRMELLLLPAAVLALWLPWWFPGPDFRWDEARPLFIPHLFFGTLAYAVMFVAALHSVLMATLERRLKPRRGEAATWLDQLITGGDSATPPLMVLERILFRLIEIGFLLLLATTLTGLVFSEETFGRPLRIEHKTVFSLIATAFFGLLLVGRRLRGWRGRKALVLANWGFALLLLSYAGSRFVLEVILKRF